MRSAAWLLAALPSLFGLAPCGVYPASGVTAGAVRSYRTFSPLPRRRALAANSLEADRPGSSSKEGVAEAVCFLWHWPSTGLDARIPDVIRHTALRSSDFPPPVHALARMPRQRPPGPPASVSLLQLLFTSVFRMVAHGFVDHLPARFCFAHQAFVEFAIEVVEFALEFSVVVEPAGIDRRLARRRSRVRRSGCNRGNGSFRRFAGCLRSCYRGGPATPIAGLRGVRACR